MRNKVLFFINRNLGIFLLGSILLGYLFPSLSVLKPMLSYLLMFLLFSSFLNLDFSLQRVLRWQLLIFPVLSWIILPIVVFWFTKSLSMPMRLGIFIITITPPALGSPIISGIMGGDTEFVVSKVVLYNLLSPLTFAFLPLLFFAELDSIKQTEIIFFRVVEFVFVPLILALLFGRMKSAKKWFLTHVKIYNGVLQLLMITVAIASATLQIKQMQPFAIIQLFLITSAIAIFLYASGFLLCAKSRDFRSTCALSAGYKNTLLAMIICITNFSDAAALPSIFYLVSHHILNGIILHHAKKR